MSGSVDLRYDEDFGEGFQRHILAVAARAPGFAVRCRDVLSADYFVADTHRAVAEALLRHIDENEGITPTKDTLVEAVREIVSEDDFEAVEAVVTEIFTESIHDNDAVEKRVVAFGKRQAMLNAVIEGAEAIERGQIDKVESLVRSALTVGENLLNLGIDYKDDFDARVDRYLNPEKDLTDQIPTGVRHLDYLLGGGLKRGELGVILAPPKKGKSTVLINFGFGALCNLDGLNVLHYSCEMDGDVITRRYDDRLVGKAVKQKKTDPEQFVATLRKRSAAVHGNLFVKDYPTRAASVATLRSHMTLLAARGIRPDVVIVDYGQILKPSERRRGEFRHEQASIYEDLRAIAGEFDCAVWSAVQANRGALEKETITMADVAEAFEIAMVCDAMVALCQTPDERVDGICRLFAAAIRDAEGERTVECSIRRDACLVQSKALYDAAGSRVFLPGEDDEDDGDPETEVVEPGVSKTRKKAAKKAVSKKGKVEQARKAIGVSNKDPEEDEKQSRRRAMPGRKPAQKKTRKRAKPSKSIPQ